MRKENQIIIPRIFFEESPEKVAKKLIGNFLVREFENIYLIGRIVEVEAYLPFNDEAAHNYKGKKKMNKSLFCQAGTAYVHSLRKYKLLDVVTEDPMSPGSVLIRAIEPIEGKEIMKKNRGVDSFENLTNGPGKICQALNINKDFDGIDLTVKESKIFFSYSESTVSEEDICSTQRVGITKATHLPLRFYLKNNPFISKK